MDRFRDTKCVCLIDPKLNFELDNWTTNYLRSLVCLKKAGLINKSEKTVFGNNEPVINSMIVVRGKI
jgi:hypothetical protein